MKVAAAQITCALGNLDSNLATIHERCVEAKNAGAELIVFPEMADTGYSMPIIGTTRAPGAKAPCRSCGSLRENARLRSSAAFREHESSCIFNSQVFIDARGEIVARYRKTHLFSPAPIEEHPVSPRARIRCGRDRRNAFGPQHLLRFALPEVYRRLAVEEQTTAFAISSAWPFPRVEHLRVLATARAIENQSYLLLANRVGTDAGVTFCGTSAIIDPYGVVVAAASADREELIVADVSSELVSAVRDRMPALEHRRDELYR